MFGTDIGWIHQSRLNISGHSMMLGRWVFAKQHPTEERNIVNMICWLGKSCDYGSKKGTPITLLAKRKKYQNLWSPEPAFS